MGRADVARRILAALRRGHRWRRGAPCSPHGLPWCGICRLSPAERERAGVSLMEGYRDDR